MMSSETQTPTLVPGRSCGECSLCCKVMQVDEFEKPQGVWCRHCAPGRGGCTIHPTRPAVCREFFCNWLVSPNLGPEWRPLTSKMILFFQPNGNRLAVHVSADHPDVWRREPYHGQLKRWSVEAIEARQQIVVYVKRRAIVILPDRDVDLGEVDPLDHIKVGYQDTPRGRIWSAAKIPAKDVPPEYADKWVTSSGMK
jgi:hypothetical protein